MNYEERIAQIRKIEADREKFEKVTKYFTFSFMLVMMFMMNIDHVSIFLLSLFVGLAYHPFFNFMYPSAQKLILRQVYNNDEDLYIKDMQMHSSEVRKKELLQKNGLTVKNVKIVSTSKKKIGVYEGNEIWSWIDIKDEDSDSVIRCEFHGTFTGEFLPHLHGPDIVRINKILYKIKSK